MTHEQAFWVDIALLIALLAKGRSQDAMATNIPDNIVDPRDNYRV